jgi:chromosomal replication initiator protein
MDEIKATVTAEWQLRPLDLVSARRSRDVSVPRQVAYWLARQLTPLSLPQIGRHLGLRDHTTVRSGIIALERLMAEDEDLAATVQRLRVRLAPYSSLPAEPPCEVQLAFLHGPLFDVAGEVLCG